MDKEKNSYSDFANVKSQENDVLPEPTPEGPYGSPINRKPGKSTPWREGQGSSSAFVAENKSLHEGLPRQYPGAHPPHDDPEKTKKFPYRPE